MTEQPATQPDQRPGEEVSRLRLVVAQEKAEPRPSVRERLVLRVLRVLGFEVAEPPAQREVEFLECAPELVGAIRGGHPRFAHVAMASFLARSEHVEENERATLRREFPAMLEHFERANGQLVRWYMAEKVFAAAALTDRDDIVVSLGRRLPAGSAELVDLVRCCQQVAYSAWHRIAPFDRRQCQNMIFSVIEEALRRLDTSGRVADDACLAPLTNRLREAEEFMLRCAARRAQGKYLKGMLLGTAGTGVVVAAVATALLVGDHFTRLAGQLLLVATAGAVGAVVSVLWRMTSGSFRMNLPTLSHEMKGTDVRLMAAFRPVIGLVFALAVIVLVMGALIPVDQRSGVTQTALFAGIAFLAGFSERLAQDMFVRSGQGLAGVMGDSPSAGPSAGLSPPPGAQVTTGRARRSAGPAEPGFARKTRVVSAS
jgi:hypothetical protein